MNGHELNECNFLAAVISVFDPTVKQVMHIYYKQLVKSLLTFKEQENNCDG